jgi:hypothetical protein
VFAISLLGYPRVERLGTRDVICDLQQSLLTDVLWLDSSRTISTLGLIRELAHTMGSAHYDNDASEFIDLMGKITVEQIDYVIIFMCQTAGTVATLSSFVLEELTKRNLIE